LDFTGTGSFVQNSRESVNRNKNSPIKYFTLLTDMWVSIKPSSRVRETGLANYYTA
jgi:hypothetical protein